MSENVEAKAASGAKGGKATLKKYGPEHFRELAGKRRTFAGGRPPNEPNKSTRKAKRKRRKVNA